MSTYNSKDLIRPEDINPDSLKKKTKQIRRNNDIVERDNNPIVTDDGKELLT